MAKSHEKKRARIIIGTMAYIPWALWDQQGLRKKEEAVQADIENRGKRRVTSSNQDPEYSLHIHFLRLLKYVISSHLHNPDPHFEMSTNLLLGPRVFVD